MTPIHVTKPWLPPLSEFQPALDTIWSTRRLTNDGPFHREFEIRLADYLEVPHVSLFCNATIALITALQALRLTGEVITTPFTFVATTNALFWNRLKPVFVDIDPVSFGIDPTKIEAAITPDTSAIFPVHVYGRPCNTDAIGEIAATHNLKVIYDAAHTFGGKHNRKHLAAYGDLSVLSFHATKLFNTFEGGAVVSHTEAMKKRIDRLRNFGFMDETTETIMEPGLNGKMSEIAAAMGLIQLDHAGELLAKRKYLYNRYWDKLPRTILPPYVATNGSYCPILLSDRFVRDRLWNRLKDASILSRRYFFPLVSEFPAFKRYESARWENLQVAHRVADQVLCLPIYHDMTEKDQDRVVETVKAAVLWA